MGSFIGHVDEATFFALIALWWMCIIFPRHIRALRNDTHYISKLSYGLPCCRKIPVEAIFKMLFPIAGFIGELANGVGPHFLTKDGQFQKLNGMQHMTIYGIFFLHGVIDILCYCKVKAIPPGSEHFSVFLAFLWYGLSFTFHANMPGKSPLEKMIHILPTYVIFFLCLLILLHYVKKFHLAADLGRVWCLMVLGTWFIHTSFIMYIPWGSRPNQDWDRHDHRNVHFVVAAFGAHCCLHLVTVPCSYALCYVFVARQTPKKRISVNGSYNKCLDECEVLIDSP